MAAMGVSAGLGLMEVNRRVPSIFAAAPPGCPPNFPTQHTKRAAGKRKGEGQHACLIDSACCFTRLLG